MIIFLSISFSDSVSFFAFMIVLLADLIFSHQSERDELPTVTEWVIFIWVSNVTKIRPYSTFQPFSCMDGDDEQIPVNLIIGLHVYASCGGVPAGCLCPGMYRESNGSIFVKKNFRLLSVMV